MFLIRTPLSKALLCALGLAAAASLPAKDFGSSLISAGWTEHEGDNTASVFYPRSAPGESAALIAENGSNILSSIWLYPGTEALISASADNVLEGITASRYSKLTILAGHDNTFSYSYPYSHANHAMSSADVLIRAGNDNRFTFVGASSPSRLIAAERNATFTVESLHGSNYMSGQAVAAHEGGTVSISAGADNYFEEGEQKYPGRYLLLNQGGTLSVTAEGKNVLSAANGIVLINQMSKGTLTLTAGTDNIIKAPTGVLNESIAAIRAGGSNYLESPVTPVSTGYDLAVTEITAESGSNVIVATASSEEEEDFLSPGAVFFNTQQEGSSLKLAAAQDNLIESRIGNAVNISGSGKAVISAERNILTGSSNGLMVIESDAETTVSAAKANRFTGSRDAGIQIAGNEYFGTFFVYTRRLSSLGVTAGEENLAVGRTGLKITDAGSASLSAGKRNAFIGTEASGISVAAAFDDITNFGISASEYVNGSASLTARSETGENIASGAADGIRAGAVGRLFLQRYGAILEEDGQEPRLVLYYLFWDGYEAPKNGSAASAVRLETVSGINSASGAASGISASAKRYIAAYSEEGEHDPSEDTGPYGIINYDAEAFPDTVKTVNPDYDWDNPNGQPYFIDVPLPEFSVSASASVVLSAESGSNVITGGVTGISAEGCASGETCTASVTVSSASGTNAVTGGKTALSAKTNGRIAVIGSSTVSGPAAAAAEGEGASIAISYGRNSSVTGDITSASGASVTLAPLAGGDLRLTGSARTDRVGTIDIELSSDSLWDMTASSRITRLAGTGPVAFRSGGDALETETLEGSHAFALDLSKNGAESDMLYIVSGTAEKQTLAVKNGAELAASMQSGDAVRFATVRRAGGGFGEGSELAYADGAAVSVLTVEYRDAASDPLNTAEYNDAYNGDGTRKPTTADVEAIYGGEGSSNVYLVKSQRESAGGRTAAAAGKLVWRYATDLDTYTRRSAQSAEFMPGSSSGAWLRTAYHRQEADGAGSLHGPFWELGFSGDAAGSAERTHRIGFSAGYSVQSGSWAHDDGSVRVKDASAALYYTLLDGRTERGEALSYWDSVLRFRHLRSRTDTLDALSAARYRSTRTQEAVSLSTEYGRRFALSETVSITPQAQFQLARIGGFDTKDGQGMITSAGHDWSAIARIGFDLSRNWGSDRRSSAYLKASVLHEFADGQEISVSGGASGARFEHSGGARGTWTALGLGVSRRLGDKAYVYFDGETEVGGGRQNSYVFTGGLKYAF